MPKQVTYSVVIPVFRGEETLVKLANQLNKLEGILIKEIIFVFDNGLPKSWEIIKQLSEQYQNVKGISLSRNYGQHNATICGIQHSTADFIITMDEDLQHNPKEISILIKNQSINNYDLVYGVYHELNHSFFRNFTSKILKKLLIFGIPELHRDYSSYRLIKKEVANRMVDMKNSYTFLDGYLTWITTNVSSVKIKHHNSQSGESSYTLRKLIEHSINIFVTFSGHPIRFLTYLSLLFFVFSFAYSFFIIISALTSVDYDAGFPTIVSMLGFGFGSLLLGLGIVGEYIQRINLKTTNRPNYNIREIKE
jgi:undecaprenyl-phosphate 4-deoxy-4-formamido-L-arabinose transferase